MQKQYKLSFIIFLIITTFLVIYIPSSMYLFDPLQIWHKSYFYPNKYSKQMRESARAFIRDYDFDSVIIGNSHMENTSAKKASEILGGKFFNLSITGSSAKDKYIILSYLFKKKKIDKVVYLVDTHYITLFNRDTSTYDFLYNNSPKDDMKIYFNSKYFLSSIGLKNMSKCLIDVNPDRPYYWEDDPDVSTRFGGFDKWILYKDNYQIKADFDKVIKTDVHINNDVPDDIYIEKMHKRFDDYILNLVAENPDIKFYLVISPESDLSLARWIRSDELIYAKYKLMLKYLTQFEEKYDNMEIYAFNDLNSVSKMEDYKDLTHYRTWVNYFILESIAKKEHKITKNNIDKYLSDVFNKAKSVDFDYYRKIITESVKNNG